ncbi:efflux RND transporter periplasmic adaptor subunit [Immundisolibacter sp.]|uniref:efflux RND transporter periplasmic adaptor subunit n=1 Tax=Immundisolibacter sp. TaxID=1934948 RepID=UPI003566903B
MRAWLFTAAMAGLLLAGVARAGEPAAPVTLAAVEQVPATVSLTLPGSVIARREAELSVEVAGLVAELAVDAGDRVQAGDVLLGLRQRPQELTLAAARAEVQRARARAELATVQARRQGDLLRRQMTPQDSYDQALALRREAAAELASAEARVALLEDELARHTLKAPFDGVIDRKLTELGAWVRPGDAVLRLVELAALRVEFALPQAHYPLVEPGTPVQLRFDAIPGDPLQATVARLIAVGQPAARTFRVQVELSNPRYRYAPGMSVDATLMPAAGATVTTVPRDALVRRPDGSALLWLAREQDGGLSAVALPVRPGRALGDRLEVSADGLSAGARVVVHGNERLRPGQALRVVDVP